MAGLVPTIRVFAASPKDVMPGTKPGTTSIKHAPLLVARLASGILREQLPANLPCPKRHFLWRIANAIGMRACRHLRDCDAALHRRKWSRVAAACSLHRSTSPRVMAEIRVKRVSRICAAACHCAKSTQVERPAALHPPLGPERYCRPNATRQGQNGFPHEPHRARLLLHHRFGMLPPRGVEVITEAV